jgi:hypothetical protein
MIIEFACSFNREFSTGLSSPRSYAALGMVNCGFSHSKYVEARQKALQTRRNVLLVCKTWNEMGKDHIYSTIVITDGSRRFLPELIAKFLANPKLAGGVQRVELRFSVNRNSVELISAMVRGLLKHCPNLSIVDDFVTREASKRSVTPIEVAMQAAGEIPFAVALGNRHYGSIKQVRFSRESTAAFTPQWFVSLWKLLDGIEILCLNDFPGWKDLPIIQDNTGGNNDGSDSGIRHGRRSRHRRHRTDDSDDSPEDSDDSEYEEEADDEDEKELEPLKFDHLHTFNMALIKETRNAQFANAFTKYIGSWTMPALTQLALSIYNVECIPTGLLKQYGDQLITLCLHNFSPLQTPAPAPANDTETINETGSRTQIKTKMTLEDKKAILPKVTTVMVVPNYVDPSWVDTFSCPSVGKYIMSYFSYFPTPHNPDDYGIIPPKPAWSAHWTKIRAHLEMCLDETKMPDLTDVWVMDCEFFDGKSFSNDTKAFWEKWETRLEARGVCLTGGMRGAPDHEQPGKHFAPGWKEARDHWDPGWRAREEQLAEVQRRLEQGQKIQEAKGKVPTGTAASGAHVVEGKEPVQPPPAVEGEVPAVNDASQVTTAVQSNGVAANANTGEQAVDVV